MLQGGAKVEVDATIDPMMLLRLIAALLAETVSGADQ
jgi:hypothetical protein